MNIFSWVKGDDVGINQISMFEAKVASGNAQQSLSRDIYRLASQADFFRGLSIYYTTVGFYFSAMITVWAVFVFLYARCFQALSSLDRIIFSDNFRPFEKAISDLSIYQMGLFLVIPLLLEEILEKGFSTAIGELILMQLQLASWFFTFQLGTKCHYFGRSILHSGVEHRATGRGFVVYHARFDENYRIYSRSHFIKGFELLTLLTVDRAYGSSYDSLKKYLFVNLPIWFLVLSWLFAPYIFNPSCFEWQKTVEDWTAWKNWISNLYNISAWAEESWEVWWISEQQHLKKTSVRGLLVEIVISLRFLFYQYGIVYNLNIARPDTSILVYALSWLVLAAILFLLMAFTIGSKKMGTKPLIEFHIFKAIVFLTVVLMISFLYILLTLQYMIYLRLVFHYYQQDGLLFWLVKSSHGI